MRQLVLLAACALAVGALSTAHGAGNLEGLVCNTEFVAGKIGDPSWVILDGRGLAEYLKGHIPGAVNFGKPVVAVLKHPVDGRMVPVEEAEKLLGQIGVSNDKGLIIYGTKGDYHVACDQGPLFWGVKQVCYLDGGYEAWADEGRKVDTGKVNPQPAPFKARVTKPEMIVSTEEMLRIVKDKVANVTIIDTRSVKEYNAEENTVLRGGRIPGAVSIPYEKNIDLKTGKLLPTEMLAEVYKSVPRDHRVILYCHRGCRTAFAYYALSRLGYKSVSIYEDGYVVWGGRPDTPVEHEHYINLRPVVGGVQSLLERVQALEKKLEAK